MSRWGHLAFAVVFTLLSCLGIKLTLDAVVREVWSALIVTVPYTVWIGLHAQRAWEHV